MLINGQLRKVLIDSGSSINVLSKFDFDTLDTKGAILPYGKNAYGFQSDTPLRTIGQTNLLVENPFDKKKCEARFVIVPNTCSPIIGIKTALELDMIRIGLRRNQVVAWRVLGS